MKAISVAAVALALGAAPALAITVTSDQGAGPESITAAPDGGLILGSGNKPAIYRAAKGETKAKPWIDVSADGNVSFLGVLADTSSNTLWACELGPRGAPGTPSPSTLLGFDLTSGAPKMRWKLPGDSSVCNDIAIGPDDPGPGERPELAGVGRLDTGDFTCAEPWHGGAPSGLIRSRRPPVPDSYALNHHDSTAPVRFAKEPFAKPGSQ